MGERGGVGGSERRFSHSTVIAGLDPATPIHRGTAVPRCIGVAGTSLATTGQNRW